MQSEKYTASVEAEFGAKVSASTELAFSSTTTETLHNELERTLRNSKTSEYNVDQNSFGVTTSNRNHNER